MAAAQRAVILISIVTTGSQERRRRRFQPPARNARRRQRRLTTTVFDSRTTSVNPASGDSRHASHATLDGALLHVSPHEGNRLAPVRGRRRRSRRTDAVTRSCRSCGRAAWMKGGLRLRGARSGKVSDVPAQFRDLVESRDVGAALRVRAYQAPCGWYAEGAQLLCTTAGVVDELSLAVRTLRQMQHHQALFGAQAQRASDEPT